MTEAEARKKWCPQTRTLVLDTNGTSKCQTSPNRIYSFKSEIEDAEHYKGNIVKGSNCLGARCMMWRWMKTFGEDGEVIYSDVDGYCGLAGHGS